MTDDIKLLRLVISCSKPGATHDGRIAFTYRTLKDSAANIGVELASAKRVFAAMRELGFEELKGGSGGARYVIELRALIAIVVPVARHWLARLEREESK